MIKQYEKSFNEKIDSFKDHEKYERLRKHADIAISNHTGFGSDAIIAGDFMDRIIAMPREYICDWLEGNNNLQWRKQDKLLLKAYKGGYEELQAQYPDVEIQKIDKSNLNLYYSFGFMLLHEEKETCLVAKVDEINTFKGKQYENLSDNGKKLYEIFKKEFLENGDLYNGCIPMNSTIATAPCFSAINELVQANIIQLRNCDGFAYELTEMERKIISESKDNNLYIRVISADICDLLEDLLGKYDLIVPSEDREGEEDEGRIFGEIYYSLEDQVTEIIIDLCEKVKAAPDVVINIEDYNEFEDESIIPRDKIMIAVLDDGYYEEKGSYPEEFTDILPHAAFVFDTPEDFFQKWYELPEGAWYWCFDKGELFCSGAIDPSDIEIFKEHFDMSFTSISLGLPKELRITAAALAVDTDSVYEDKSEISGIIGDYLSDMYGYCHKGFDYEVHYNEFNEPSEVVVTDIQWDVDEDLKEVDNINEKKSIESIISSAKQKCEANNNEAIDKNETTTDKERTL